jgi:hypothetical protein
MCDCVAGDSKSKLSGTERAVMAVLGLLLMGIGYLVAFIGGIWIVVIAFQESILWGLGSLLVPLVGLIYVAMHWEETKKPFLILVGGIVVAVLGIIVAGAGGGGAGG